MNRIRLRSARDPGFWVPLLLSVLLFVPLAIGAHLWVSGFLERLQQDAAADPAAAIDAAVSTIRRSVWLLCTLLAVFCAYLFRYSQLARREGRLPPAGWWSYGALHAIIGARARRMGRFGQWLAGLLLAASVGLAFAVEHLVTLLEGGGLLE